ncbi:translocated promoter region b, nuclear basket protein isoform X2 [Hemiscyllium ocellatum]|uniref:translocated promoter region b, nuclear basket protein isoform X2 n=1 Tax=Hemiscyllium ocellatum TaxID=170820 RepID=UPI002965F2A9|nr:translocated promoter region b, nuclear basket protein isoform X2 [Hemiscyllium ocellatum]
MAADVLQQFFDRGELAKLPRLTVAKLEKLITDKEADVTDLKAKYERFKIDSEQQYFEVEKRLTQGQEKLVSEMQECQKLREEVSALNEQLKVIKAKNEELGSAQEKLISVENQLARTKDELDSEKRELVRTLERRSQEVERLNEDLKCLNDKLVEANSAKIDLQLKLDEFQVSEVSVKYREKRLEQEKELLTNQNTWLNAELKTKTDELLKLRREKSNEILELKCSLETKKDEMCSMDEQMQTLKVTKENFEKQIEELMSKLKESKEQSAVMEERFRNELNAHVKLSNLYKGSADDAEAKATELTRAVEELHSLLKQANEAHKITEDQLIEVDASKTKLVAELNEKINQLEKELENANHLLSATKRKGVATLSEEELSAMSPTAAAVAKIVKPGMKLTELYNGYVEAQDQLLLAKQENKRVSKYLAEIVKEVEMKAPLLRRQREEYHRVQKAVPHLSAKLEEAMKEIRRLQKDTDQANKHSSLITRENQRLKMQVSDLSQQNRILLMELEDARGNHILREDEVSSADISSSSEVITQHLVTYRNVEELQQQNQQLLVAIRELAEKQEKEEQEKTSTRISELEVNLSEALSELERLRKARTQQMHLVESIVRQRDMYRILLAQMTGVTIPIQETEGTSLISTTPKSSPRRSEPMPQMTSTPAPTPVAESTELVQAKTALKQLQLHFESYKTEKAENDKMLNEQNEKLQDQLTQLRNQRTKLSTQLEFASKRYEMLQNNVDGFRREVASLRDRCQKLTTTVQKQEHIISNVTQDLRASNEKLALEETRGENLRKEQELLKMIEVRLTQERDSKFAALRGQNLLLTNLQSIQLTLERAETETRQRLNSQIEKQEHEIEKLKKKVDQWHSLGRNQDIQILELKKQLETESNLHVKTKELLKNAEKEINALKLSLNNVETELAEIKGSDSKGKSNTEDDVDDLQTQLRQAEEQANELRERLETTTSNVEKYRDMVIDLEESLSKEKQVTEEVRDAVETRLKEAAEYQTQLEKRLLEAENEKQALTDEKLKAIENLEQQICELRKNLKSLQAELYDAVQQATTATTNEQQARADCQEQARIASEAQNKYERELMLHAADVEALQIAKEQVAMNSQERQKLEDAAQKAETQMLEYKTAKDDIERILKDEISQLITRNEDLQKQNKLLLEQVESLSNKMVTTVQEANQSSLNISFNEEGKSQEQLLEILRFVRREREIAETRFEVAQVESLRYRQQVENLERELKEMQENLNSEREKMQVTAKTLAQHDELMKKTETMNVLIETNKMLRDEKERLEQELQQSRAKIYKMESDILPLQESNTELSEKSGMLQAEKKLLEEDLKRWKARAQQLISLQKETDPDEYKKLVSEKDTNTKRIQQLTEEIGKLKTELARLNASSSVSQRDVQTLKTELSKVTNERDKLKQEMLARVSDIQEKNKTITQVKKIGRRYKTQYEELKAQHDKMVAEASSQLTAEQQAEQSSSQATQELQETLAQSESRAKALESQAEALQKSVTEKESEVTKLQDEVSQLHSELARLRQELQDKGNLEEQLRQQIVEKEEKTKKAILVAKQKITQLAGLKEQLAQENEQLKQHNEEFQQRITSLDQQREELEVRMSALKSQYDGHIARLKRELKEHQDRQHEQREEPQEITKTSEPQRQLDQQRQITLKQTPASVDRGSLSISDPPTANIKPTPLVATPSKVAAGPVAGSKSTPRASIRPMVTPATVTGPATTPTATVMPTTQVETQEAMQSEGPVEHVTVFGSTSGTVRSTSPNIPNLSQPILTVQQQQTQATAFVQPTQQTLQVEPANQEPSSSIVDVIQSSQVERPSTSTAVFGTVSATTMSKRQREDDDEMNAENVGHSQDESLEHQSKKLRVVRVEEHLQEVEESAETENNMQVQPENLDSQDSISQVVIEDYPPSQLMEDNEETSHSLDLVPQPPEHQQNTQSSQNSQTQTEYIIIESDEDPENEEDQEQEEYDEDDEDDDTGIEDGDGEDSNGGSPDGEDNYDGGDAEGADGTEQSAENEQSGNICKEGESTQIPEDNSAAGEGNVPTTDSYTSEASREQQAISERQAPRLLRSPRRPPHPLPPRLTIQPPAQELGPPAQRFPPARRPSSSRGGIQLTPGVGGVQHFFDEDDRMVPSTPTLVVPHRSDGFAEAIHSPQVIGVPRFRFGPPEDMSQTSSSQSDLGQLASQGGLGMYETPIYLAAVHEDESGGRSVPTTPLQVHAPVTVFNEGAQSDVTEHASQSVPMVTTSTGGLSSTADSGGGDDGDEVFMEAVDQEGLSSDVMEIEGHQEEESVQPSEEADLPSTSQDPPSSSADASVSQPKPLRRVRLYPQMGRTVARGRQFISRRGTSHSMSGRGINRGNHN